MAFRPNKSFRDIIDDLGLSTGIQVCLDAGDLASYPGSGQKWRDRGQGHDFFLGPDGTVTGADPTFVGTAGDLKDTIYFSFDGTQFFTYDTTNEAWMQAIHKVGAKYTFANWVYIAAAGSGFSLAGTRGAAAGNTGFSFFKVAGNALNLAIQNAGVAVAGITGTVPIDIGWVFLAASIDATVGPGGGVFQVNGTQELVDSTYTAPSAGNASFTMQIAARGNNDVPASNNNRLGAFMAWNRALSAAELMSLYKYPGLVFSDTGGQRVQNRMIAY